ncbi:MAG TPA: YbaK/EbsC family protein [Variovorax sp.]|nr:YbaK/EbsC family protein [Variovorax sp.]
MSIAAQLSDYLTRQGARYEVRMHEHSRTSAETARCANLPASQLAKSVILEDETGCVMAVVPADRIVMLGEFARLLGRNKLRLAQEERVAQLFEGCEPGAIPAIGMAWGIPTIVDDELESNEVVYVEGGDHERVLRMTHEQFHELMRAQPHGNFSRTPMH